MAVDPAERPLLPGPCLQLRHGALEVAVAPQAGGRLAQVRHHGHAWLVGPGDGHDGAIAWGCYPMLPWAGRIRHGAFAFGGRRYVLPANLGAHAIHGVGFDRPWQVQAQSASACRLLLTLPQDAHWPFGGQAVQEVQLEHDRLALRLTLTAGDQPMPHPVLGWHPWLRKPDQLEFQPHAQLPRDADGIAVLPPHPPGPGPWDDCFLNDAPVAVRRDQARLVLRSDCDHWVVYDQPAHATCVEPQSGPPDAFNLRPEATLAAGATVQARFDWQWR